jgi:hypothetical protein
LWCLRWSATQRITGPSIASEPATAQATFNARLGLKDLCVNRRWKPTVMPCPEIAYITTAMSTSLQPSQPPQATGTAATTARNGSTMNAASATCSTRDWRSPPQLAVAVAPPVASAVAGPDRAALDWVLDWVLDCAASASVVGGVMWVSSRCSGELTYASVTYGTVGR